MRKGLMGAVVALALLPALSGCGGRQIYPLDAYRPPGSIPAEAAQGVDGFLIVMDTSPWTKDISERRAESEQALEIVLRLNRTIPALDYRASLVASDPGGCFGCEGLRFYSGPAAYRREAFEAALLAGDDGEKGKRMDPSNALDELRRVEVLGRAGRTALIVVSDAENIFHGAAAKNVQKMKAAMGERLCVYPILIGREPGGPEVMNLLAAVGRCGFSVNAEEIATPDQMADYVSAVFLGKVRVVSHKGAAASEGDGDGDGVPDERDACPHTPSGARAGADGCWQPKAVVYFDPGRAMVGRTAALEEVLGVMRANPELRGEAQGHADSSAGAAYNHKLSIERAEALRAVLIQRGIAAERIGIAGFGESRPAAGNETAEGRSLNRRAEFVPAVR